MDFFVSINNQKEGPLSHLKVGGWIEDGKVDENTLGWHQGMEEWKPLSEIPALESFFEKKKPPVEPPPLPEPTLNPTSTPPVSTGSASNKHPFLRAFARFFDYTVVAVIVFLFSDVEFPQPGPGESFADLLARYLEQMQEPEARVLARTQLIALVVWQLLEGIFIHMVGTTPGKALMGIRVRRDDGNNLTIKQSIGRSFYVYILGAGFYQFPFILIGGVFSFFRLQGTGKCLWDQHLKTTVEAAPITAGRIFLAIAAFFILIMLQSVKFS